MKNGINDKKSKKRDEFIVCYDYPTGVYSQGHGVLVYESLEEALSVYFSDIFSEKYHKRQGILIRKYDEKGELGYCDLMDHKQVLKFLRSKVMRGP